VAHRSIGQERFGFAGRARPASSLDALIAPIDWGAVALLVDPLYPAAKGKPAWPPPAMFKALLLSIWYDLSDVKLTEALDDQSGGVAVAIGIAGPSRIRPRGTALRPKPCKLACHPGLRRTVSRKLRRSWSPEQIAGWLKRSFPDEEQHRVSHETIYKSLFIQALGVLDCRS